MYFNSIFLIPPITNPIYRKYLKDKYNINDNNINDFAFYKNCMNDIQSYNNDFILITKSGNINTWCNIENKYWIADYEKYCFLKHILENIENNGIIHVICHELYHKWQFSASPITPIFYVANFFISLFFGYELASNIKWTIEGDVRVSVDNEHLQNIITKFSDCFQTLKHYAFIKRLEILLNTPKYKQILLQEECGSETIDNYQEQIRMFYEPSFKITSNGPNKIEYNDFDNDRETKKSYEFRLLFNILKEYQVLTPEFISFVEQN